MLVMMLPIYVSIINVATETWTVRWYTCISVRMHRSIFLYWCDYSTLLPWKTIGVCSSNVPAILTDKQINFLKAGNPGEIWPGVTGFSVPLWWSPIGSTAHPHCTRPLPLHAPLTLQMLMDTKRKPSYDPRDSPALPCPHPVTSNAWAAWTPVSANDIPTVHWCMSTAPVSPYLSRTYIYNTLVNHPRAAHVKLPISYYLLAPYISLPLNATDIVFNIYEHSVKD